MIRCPHCGKEIHRFPKRIRLHDHRQITDKFQMIEHVSDINPPYYSPKTKYSSGKVSRIMIYHITEDK